MAQQGIKVGVFSDHCDEGPVPSNLVGKQIWYSYERREYWIIDDNRQFVNKFYAAKFAQFVKINAIIFTSDTIRSEMINEANRVLAGGAAPSSTGSQPVVQPAQSATPVPSPVQPVSAPMSQMTPPPYVPQQQMPYNTGSMYNASSLPGQWGQQQPQMYTPSSSAPAQQFDDVGYGTQELISQTQNTNERRPSRAKDPSRHLFGFFLTCAILTIVAMIIIMFGESLVANVSTLIS